MNILFVCHNGIDTNSGNHVANFAKAVIPSGIDVAVCVPDEYFSDSSISNSLKVMPWSEAATFRFSNGQEADFIHAWTPRQHVAKITRELALAHGCNYLVHLEDNEYVVTSSQLGITQAELLARSDSIAIPSTLADPFDMHDFLRSSAGVTALIKSLLEFRPINLPGLEIWPAAEKENFYPTSADPLLRRQLGLGDHSKVIVYHGNVHSANVLEVRSLYLAIAALWRAGVDIFIVRLGKDYVDPLSDAMREFEQRIVHVPFQPREKIRHYLALADLFVQPGRVDEFNIYRFPSKLPEFLAMGKPVVLPATNVGCSLIHGENAYLLKSGDGLEIAGAIQSILSDAALSARLSSGALRFSEENLSWASSGGKLADFYNLAFQRLN